MNTKAQEMRRSYRTPDAKAQIDWSLEQKENGLEFRAQGEFDRSSGQCIDSVAKAYPQDETVQRLARIWERWHLNGMRAGTSEQHAEIERRKVQAEDLARQDSDAAKYFYDDELSQANWHSLCHKFGHDSFYSWECAVLREAGLYEFPLLGDTMKATGGFPPEVLDGSRGYRFGERWIFEPIPQSVIDELKQLHLLAKVRGIKDNEHPREPLHEHKAKQFLTNNGLKLRATLSNTKAASWQPSGHHYRVTLSRGSQQTLPKPDRRPSNQRLVFDFWGSKADADAGKTELTPYDVLACISGDIYTPETFEEFCDSYGYERDSIKALQTFRRADRFAKRLQAFFTGQEQEQLAEIS